MSGDEREGLPYPEKDDNGTTHWEGCWRERGHHNCAVEMVERLTQAQEPVSPSLLDALDETEGLLQFTARTHDHRSPRHHQWMDRAQAVGYASELLRRHGFPVEPVGASPVASAPCREDEAQAVGAMGATHDAHQQLADVAGRMKVYGYDEETLRVLTDHILGGAEIPMPSAPEPYDASKEPIALNFLDNIFDCWKMGGDALDRFMRAQRRQIEDVLASAPVWPEPGAPAPATKPPLGKIRPSAPEEEREAYTLEEIQHGLAVADATWDARQMTSFWGHLVDALRGAPEEQER